MGTYMVTYNRPADRWQSMKPLNKYEHYKKTAVKKYESDENRMHQWPWRGLAFASDLGILAHLVGKPGLAGAGWLIAVPYYLYSIVSQSNKVNRKEEALYQATANGIFPLLAAKLGTVAGKLIGVRFPRIPLLASKGVGGVLALATLTPAIGDPVSKHIVQNFRIYRGGLC